MNVICLYFLGGSESSNIGSPHSSESSNVSSDISTLDYVKNKIAEVLRDDNNQEQKTVHPQQQQPSSTPNQQKNRKWNIYHFPLKSISNLSSKYISRIKFAISSYTVESKTSILLWVTTWK